MKTAFTLLFLFLLTSCQAPLPAELSSLVPAELVRLSESRTGGHYMAFDHNESFGSKDNLHFFLNEKGTEVLTRYLGPGGYTPIPTGSRTRVSGDWTILERWVRGAERSTIIAMWRHDESGKVVDAHLRKEPYYEWRGSEWRPFENGTGVGNWREL